MSISEFLFGKWEIIESIPASFNRRVLWKESEEEGEIRVEKNRRTGYERARLVEGNVVWELDLHLAKKKIKEYKIEYNQ